MKGFRLMALVLALALAFAGCGEKPAVSITAWADFSELEKGKIAVSMNASAKTAGTVVTATQLRDGTAVNSWSVTADLQQGSNQLTLELGETSAEYGDRLVLSYTQGGKEVGFASRMMDIATGDKLASYLETLGGEVEPTGIGKGHYAEVTALCLAEYDRINDIRNATVRSLASNLQSYSRVLSSMAVLVDYGAEHDITEFARDYGCSLFEDYEEYKALFARMMTTGSEAAVSYAGKDVENFSVKELAIAYYLAKDHFPAEQVAAWAEPLSKVQPNEEFYSHANASTNRNGYVMGGEQLRSYLGLADGAAVEDFIDASMKRQASHFDENGMYRDEYGVLGEVNPALYDLTTRVQLQLVAGFGYEGGQAEVLDSLLRQGGLMTLFTTSVLGQLPYGGRSNQYLFNAALISANCEYEANRYAAEGNMAAAGAFKRTAHVAISSVFEYLVLNKHIMNYYEKSTIGTEDYGNYDKYMATMSSFLSIAYLFADDSIGESAAPIDRGGYVLETSDVFCSVVAAVGDYSIQLMTAVSPHYDSIGLGRIHKKGIAPELGLSMSMAAEPAYTMPPDTQPASLSLCPRWWNGTNEQRLCNATALKYELEVLQETAECVEFTLTYTGKNMKGASAVKEHYTLTPEGLTVTVTVTDSQAGKVGYTVPLLQSNGDSEFAGSPVTEVTENGFTVTMNGQTYTVTSDADSATLDETLYGNRNGAYATGLLEKSGDSLTVSFRLD